MAPTYIVKTRPEKVLPIQLEDGSVINLTIKKRTKENMDFLGEQIKVLEKEFKDGNISVFEYQAKNVELLIKDCPPGIFDSLELDDVAEIGKVVAAEFNPKQESEADKKKESTVDSKS
jgi:hypothetical protein